ncbi:MAG: hypothetical protein UX06_C0050G0001 [Candidatus Giovannonibacteria bacterium GW2011_GWA2_45_21]|uniref:LamG-like jellyroll fold domain-containing protein n=1 Tax=Candidatus Giovannonibacteria bacterium GW2011_GWA2_45_21 TaxID=1618649 RepID=A0A0G1Q2C6_9BACT|nr:MAG: hypothetical protein UX06_C0050G0001 [Candidatus Giovannonibacteria bacterium GW2011_GWA2_45_21]
MKNFKLLIIIFNFALLIFNFGIPDANAALIIQAPKYIGLTNGLVGYWSFDGADMASVTAYDRSGQGNNGTLTNGPTRVQGKIGQGLSFDGVDDYAQVTGLLGSAATVTLVVWANLNAPDLEGGDIISLGGAVALRLRDPTSSNKTYGVYRYATGWRSITTVANFDVTGWHHFVYIVNPGASSQGLYIDGVQVASGSVSDAISYSLGPNTFIGKNGNGGTTTDLNGLIDDVRVYNRVLTNDEIKRLYNLGR